MQMYAVAKLKKEKKERNKCPKTRPKHNMLHYVFVR